MIIKKIKQKTCRECKSKFTPIRSIQPVCEDFNCKVSYATKSALKAAIAREKRDKRQHKEKLEKAKPLSDYVKEAQRHFNCYIRARDLKAGYGCISCGTKECNLWVAGHYRTTKAAPQLRFNEDNVSLQCGWYCNVNNSGNIVPYRIELIKRIGLERVELLECSNETKRYTKEELIAIKNEYKLKLKELKNDRLD